MGIEAAEPRRGERGVCGAGAPALKVLRANLETLGLRKDSRVEAVSVGAFLRRMRPESAEAQFDVVFLDPPYDAADEYATTLGLLGGEARGLLAEGAVVIAEHRRKEKLEDRVSVCYAGRDCWNRGMRG